MAFKNINCYKILGKTILKTWFVSRHAGAIEWMKAQKNWHVDHWVEHLDVTLVNKGDVVIGVLPLPLVASICEKGAEFYSLVVPQTREQRGSEHSLDDLIRAKCYLMRYYVQQLKN